MWLSDIIPFPLPREPIHARNAFIASPTDGRRDREIGLSQEMALDNARCHPNNLSIHLRKLEQSSPSLFRSSVPIADPMRPGVSLVASQA